MKEILTITAVTNLSVEQVIQKLMHLGMRAARREHTWKEEKVE